MLWWAWVIFLLFNSYGIAATHSSIIHSARLAALLLLVTGVMYACTVHSRVTCDDDGVTIYNPLRSHRALWGAVEGVYVGDSVEFHCHRPAPKKDKTIHSWALSSRRRSRVKMQAQRSFISQSRRVTNQEAARAAAGAQPEASELIAAELARRASAAHGKGAPAAFLRSTWAWRPVAAIAVPAVALLVTLLVS